MTPDEFAKSDLGTLEGALRALWFARRGEWDKAHDIAQSEDSRDGALIDMDCNTIHHTELRASCDEMLTPASGVEIAGSSRWIKGHDRVDQREMCKTLRHVPQKVLGSDIDLLAKNIDVLWK